VSEAAPLPLYPFPLPVEDIDPWDDYQGDLDALRSDAALESAAARRA
jgi:hypothetical protein